MNGIIHPCCHPEGGPQPKNEDEMIMNVFKYIEHIFILYLAIDGVAPRAKMNQQRARRFRAAQERLEMTETRQKLEAYYHKKGWDVPKAPPESWDHNVITPGTPFMDKLAQALRFWVNKKLHLDPGWKGIKVILSDANIPGEGEHKIAQWIRRCRSRKGYDPNTKHVLYGLDADLFMLGLATHEVHFYVLREEVLFGKNRPCAKCGIAGHFADRCTNEPKVVDPDAKKTLKPFIFADLSILREYLDYELRIDDWNLWNLERVIDDFVFLCFFVGNDFLPHLPSLEIREGAIDNLLKYYKSMLPKFNGYLTESGGKVNLKRVNVMLQQLGDIEDKVFKNRTESDAGYKRRNEAKKRTKRKERIYARKHQNESKNGQPESKKKKYDEMNAINLNECKLEDEYNEDEVELLEFFNEYDLDVDEHFMEKDFEHQLSAIHRQTQDISKCRKKEKEEDLQFGTRGFKSRYYSKKLKIKYEDNPPLLDTLLFEYVRGLCWVMLYYYQGCVSWSWYYPFHYAPFASDLKNIDRFADHFEFDKIRSKPFSPFGQLMGVLPAASGKVALPKQFSRLMYDPNSPIIDFYPKDFKLDLNGKMYNWQAVILLPFVDANRLLKAIAPLEQQLTGDLKRMNGVGKTLMMVNKSHPMGRTILKLSEDDDQKSNLVPIDQIHSQGIHGFIGFNKDGTKMGDPLIPPKSIKTLCSLPGGVNVVSCTYKLPKYSVHQSKLLPGAMPGPPQLDATDFERMEKAPRFGKPRQFRRRDTHYNYNRGWDQSIGHSQGRYKAKHNKNSQFELHYQPTRSEYNMEHQGYYNAANRGNGGGGGGYNDRNDRDYNRNHYNGSGGGGGGGGSKWVPKNRSHHDNVDATLDEMDRDGYGDNGRDSQKCVESLCKYPVFEPYPNSCDVWTHRPGNAPSSVDPEVDLSNVDLSQNNKHNNNRRRNNNNRHHHHGHSRGYESQRNRGGRGRGYGHGGGGGRGHEYGSYGHGQYNQSPHAYGRGYSNAPQHQQWYPQQGYYGGHHQYQQPPPHYNHYQHQGYPPQQPYYPQQGYSQQEQQQHYQQPNSKAHHQPTKPSSHSRKWG